MPERLALSLKTPALLDAMHPGGVSQAGSAASPWPHISPGRREQAAGEAPTSCAQRDSSTSPCALGSPLSHPGSAPMRCISCSPTGRNSSLLNWCDPSKFNLRGCRNPGFHGRCRLDARVTGDWLNGLNLCDPAAKRYFCYHVSSVFIAPTVSGLGIHVVEVTASPLLVVYRHNGNTLFQLSRRWG